MSITDVIGRLLVRAFFSGNRNEVSKSLADTGGELTLSRFLGCARAAPSLVGGDGNSSVTESELEFVFNFRIVISCSGSSTLLLSIEVWNSNLGSCTTGVSFEYLLAFFLSIGEDSLFGSLKFLGLCNSPKSEGEREGGGGKRNTGEVLFSEVSMLLLREDFLGEELSLNSSSDEETSGLILPHPLSERVRSRFVFPLIPASTQLIMFVGSEWHACGLSS